MTKKKTKKKVALSIKDRGRRLAGAKLKQDEKLSEVKLKKVTKRDILATLAMRRASEDYWTKVKARASNAQFDDFLINPEWSSVDWEAASVREDREFTRFDPETKIHTPFTDLLPVTPTTAETKELSWLARFRRWDPSRGSNWVDFLCFIFLVLIPAAFVVTVLLGLYGCASKPVEQRHSFAVPHNVDQPAKMYRVVCPKSLPEGSLCLVK